MEDYLRLKKLIEHLKLSDGAFAIEIGVTPQSIGFIKKGRNKLGDKVKRAITKKYPFVSEIWLDKGIGDMIIPVENIKQVDNKVYNIFLENRIKEMELELDKKENIIRDLYKKMGKLEHENELLKKDKPNTTYRLASEP